MRPRGHAIGLVALLVLTAFAGCMSAGPQGGDYGLSGLLAEVTFQEPWDEGRARDGVRATGYGELTRTDDGSYESEVRGGARITIVTAPDGEWVFGVAYRWSTETGFARHEADARAREKWEDTYHERYRSVLAAFQDATGWRHSGDVSWFPFIEVARGS